MKYFIKGFARIILLIPLLPFTLIFFAFICSIDLICVLGGKDINEKHLSHRLLDFLFTNN